MGICRSFASRSARKIGRCRPLQGNGNGRDVVMSGPDEGVPQLGTEHRQITRHTADRFEAIWWTIGEFDDIAADPATPQGHADDRSHLYSASVGIRDRIPKTGVDGEGGDGRNDPGGGGQSASAALRRSSATSVRSHGNMSRPKCP